MKSWKLILVGFTLFCISFKTTEKPYLKIKEGVGVVGLIEVGKTFKDNP